MMLPTTSGAIVPKQYPDEEVNLVIAVLKAHPNEALTARQTAEYIGVDITDAVHCSDILRSLSLSHEERKNGKPVEILGNVMYLGVSGDPHARYTATYAWRSSYKGVSDEQK